MAFSNTPQNSTYRTETIKFDATSTLRSANNTVRRDSHIINMFYDRIKQEDVKQRDVALKKRPGISATSVSLNKAVSTDPIRGYFYEHVEDIYFWVVKDKVYKYIPNPAGSYTSLVCTLTTTTGEVHFELFEKASTGDVYILFSDGAKLWSQKLRTYPDTAATAVADPDLPTPHMPMFTVLDGYVFVAKGDTIYNSDNDTFDTWSVGTNERVCEMSSDNIRALWRNRNYIVAIGYNSFEMFYDAANTGESPLTRNESAFKSVGYIAAHAMYGDTSYFVGQYDNGNIGVYSAETFKVEKISNDIVERSLQATFSTEFGESRVVNAYGTILDSDGHTFYCLYTPEITWVYDFQEKFWYEWRSPTGPMAVEATWAKFNGGMYIATSGTTTIDKFSNLVYNDKNTNFTCSYTTEDNLFGSVNWKTCNRASLVCDRYQTSGTSNVTLQWSDNDWADGPTGTTTVNVFSNLPKAHRLGRFRNRSFRLLYADNYPLRMKYLELELNIGAH